MSDSSTDPIFVFGLEQWSAKARIVIDNPRLIEKLESLLATKNIRLNAPPPDLDDPDVVGPQDSPRSFPGWFVVQKWEESETNPPRRSRLLVRRVSLMERQGYVAQNGERWPVVPFRYVRACRYGHIGDIDWDEFVHHSDKASCTSRSLFYEEGDGGDLSETWIRCSCGAARTLMSATEISDHALNGCTGERPWLGSNYQEHCNEPSLLLDLTPDNSTLIGLNGTVFQSERNRDVVAAVDQVWNVLRRIEGKEHLQKVRQTDSLVRAVLGGLLDEDVWEEILARQEGNGKIARSKPVERVELKSLVSQNVVFDGRIFKHTLTLQDTHWKQWNAPVVKGVKRVAIAPRIREDLNPIEFNRSKSSDPASMTLELRWLPSIERRGEGIFIGFSKDEIESWMNLSAVKEREKVLLGGFNKWKKGHPRGPREFPGVPHVMLNTLSHLLISAVTNECGFSVGSIRGQVYAGGAGYGILVFAGSPDVVGTKGKLVIVGQQIAKYFGIALRNAGLCSSDPVCVKENPKIKIRPGASCAKSPLIAETSCERRNDFLDYALVVPTNGHKDVSFFCKQDIPRQRVQRYRGQEERTCDLSYP